MKPSTQQSQRHVHAVMAALDLLDCFESDSALTLKQLIDMTGMTRNRVMRLTGTLEMRGYLVRDEPAGTYHLGPRLLVLGKIYERSCDLVLLARPLLKDLANETGESASLYVIDGYERLVLAREEGTQEIRYSAVEGQRLPIFAGASGKVLLAYGPPSLRDELTSRSTLPRLASGTIVAGDVLSAELDRIRSDGYAISHAERSPEAGSIAVPVSNHNGELVGAIAIVGPINRVNAENKSKYVPKVVMAAQELSRLLGQSHGAVGSTR